jgi:Family of unknown function (DUF5330)
MQKGKAMMFLIRTAFWLMIVILLLPTDSKQQSEVYGTAQAAVKDVTGFCDRNPDACAKGKDVFGVFMQKAEFGFEMLMGFIENKTAPTASDAEVPAAALGATAEPASWDQSDSQNTLNPEDLAPAWNGPSPTGT